MIYTLTLNPALDYTLFTDEIANEGIFRSSSDTLSYGGKGINVSVILTRLGAENTALGFAAGFTGDELIRLISADGIKNDFVRLKNGRTRINVKIRSGSELDINAAGDAVSDGDIAALVEKIKATVKGGDTLVLSGSLPKGASPKLYADIMAELEGRDVRFAVDTSGEALLKTLKFRPFVIKPNHIELGELFGVSLSDDAQIIEYAKKLQALGAENVLVSMAENGAILLDESGAVHRAENARGTLVNSVGCGDSMLAGFLAGCDNGYGYALRLATACGNATAFSPSLATEKEIYDIMK